MKFFSVLLFIFFSGISLFAQVDTAHSQLLMNRAQENMRMIAKYPHREFKNALEIEEKAGEVGRPDVEMVILVSKCIYYKSQINFEKLMATAKALVSKARKQEHLRFQAIGKYYLFEAYLFNDLTDKAIAQLDEGMGYVKAAEQKSDTSTGLRNNFYVAYANYYLKVQNFENQLKYIKLAGGIIENMPEGKLKQEKMHLYYSNLAQAFSEIQQSDSARYYSLLSDATNPENKEVNAQFMNRLILGEIEMERNEYRSAIDFFRKAEEIDGPINHINLLKLYDNYIVSYRALQLPDSAKLYQYKKSSLRLSVSENQNKLLHTLLAGINKKYRTKIFVGVVVLLILTGVSVYIISRKKRAFINQEKQSERFLKTNQNKVNKENKQNNADSHIQLIKLLKEDNPAFIAYFHEVYPDFADELLKINPKLSNADMEFCALLKLRLPTDVIAKFKFIAPKTVQNKRYLIRKKLNIPKDIETYEWFVKV